MFLSPVSEATTYRVEVSGWDNTQSFFVEKADLEWSKSGEKVVLLRRELQEGSLLFVRLLQPISADRSHPVPYAAEHLRITQLAQWEYRLTQVQPRANQDQTSN